MRAAHNDDDDDDDNRNTAGGLARRTCCWPPGWAPLRSWSWSRCARTHQKRVLSRNRLLAPGVGGACEQSLLDAPPRA
jgi:hypothetical protein